MSRGGSSCSRMSNWGRSNCSRLNWQEVSMCGHVAHVCMQPWGYKFTWFIYATRPGTHTQHVSSVSYMEIRKGNQFKIT